MGKGNRDQDGRWSIDLGFVCKEGEWVHQTFWDYWVRYRIKDVGALGDGYCGFGGG